MKIESKPTVLQSKEPQLSNFIANQVKQQLENASLSNDSFK